MPLSWMMFIIVVLIAIGFIFGSNLYVAVMSFFLDFAPYVFVGFIVILFIWLSLKLFKAML